MTRSFLVALTGLFLCISAGSVQGRELSPAARISLLTASPGEELYSVFGHSALFVYDPVNGIDEVYNYGTFDFETPFFYYKFTRGQLLYQLSVTSLDHFLWVYHLEGRAMYEQTLNLTPEEMQYIYNFLLVNRRPENKSYHYDFFYDNCSTRIRDLFDALIGPQWHVEDFPEEQLTFRQRLKPYLNPLQWSRFGVDLALGLPADRQADYWHAMFLPDELFVAFSQARLPDDRPLVDNTQVLLEQKIEFPKGGVYFPVTVFWIVFFLGVGLMLRKKWSAIFDKLFFSFLGIIGLILFFLWFLSEHHATNNNMNLLWAVPTHLYFIFKTGVDKAQGITRLYFRIIGIINVALLVIWFWLPQDLHPAFFPIILLSAIKALDYGFDLTGAKLLRV